MSQAELILELIAIRKGCSDILVYMELTELIDKLERKGIKE